MKCHFCRCDLPEPLCTHVVFAEGSLHRIDPTLDPYPVCMRCLKFHKLKACKLVSKSTLQREGVDS
jgi:hypothetical protein